MVSAVRALRVFVASPGGVEAERDAVEAVAGALNGRIGASRGVALTVRRFEQMVGGAGNPQTQINPGVEECDVLIGIVHRQWGTDTGNGYDSGFKEEFERALARWESTGSPRIALFFKRIDDESLRDPGDQLKKVLEFRRSIEEHHSAFYKNFDSTDEFSTWVTQLLAEEIVDIPMDTQGEGGEPTGAEATQRTQVRESPLSDEVAGVLSIFSEAMAGRAVTDFLDVDRLELFALSVSRDRDTIPTHLANRIFARRRDVALIGAERRAWFRTYLSDLGRSDTSADRAIPYPAANGGRDSVAELADQGAVRYLTDEEGWVSAGYLRLATALNLRPRAIWPTCPLSESDAETFRKAWRHPAKNAQKLAITYWLTVRRTRDVGLARVLASSSDNDVARLGNLLSSLLKAKPDASALAEILPEFLIEKLVASVFPEENPLGTLALPALESLALRKYGKLQMRLAALDELIRREQVTRPVIISTLETSRVGSILGDDWPEAAGERLYDRKASAAFLSNFLTAVSDKESLPDIKDQVRVAIARLARHDETFAAGVSTLIEPSGHFDPHNAEVLLRRHEGSSNLQAVAEALAAGTHEEANEYLAMLEQVGATDPTLAFVKRQYESIALHYLSKLPGARRHKQHVQRIRELAHGDGPLRYEALSYLIDVFEDRDIDLLLERSKFMSGQRSARALSLIVGRASLNRLRSMSTSNSDVVAVPALQELQRRGRRLSNAKLMTLLRGNSSQVRLAALTMLIDNSTTSDLEKLLDAYQSGSGTHYYNVVCEIDRRLGQIPAMHSLLK